LAWIQKHLDEKFTKNQLLKNIYQPNSVQDLIPTKKSKIQQDISENINTETEEEENETIQNEEKTNEDEESDDGSQNEDFLDRISIKRLTE
jgi:hypothetical protein